MTDPNRALASAIQQSLDFSAFEDVTGERFDALDLTSLLIYLIDTVDVSALPFLADQFDVDGLKGFGLAQTVQQRRQVVAEAIDLVKLRGTVAGIKRGLEAIGYPNSGVQERIGVLHNGVWLRDGTRTHGSDNWATFAVWVNNNLETPTPGELDLIRQMIEIYKNARSLLVQLVFAAAIYSISGEALPGLFAVSIENEPVPGAGTGAATAAIDEATNDGATFGSSEQALRSAFGQHPAGIMICPCSVYKAGTLYAFVNPGAGADIPATTQTVTVQAIPPASFDPDSTATFTYNNVTYAVPVVVADIP